MNLLEIYNIKRNHSNLTIKDEQIIRQWQKVILRCIRRSHELRHAFGKRAIDYFLRFKKFSEDDFMFLSVFLEVIVCIILLYPFFAHRIPSNGRICAKQGSLMIFFHSLVAPAILIQPIFNWNFLTGSAMSNYFTIKNVFQSNVKEIFKSLINEGQ